MSIWYSSPVLSSDHCLQAGGGPQSFVEGPFQVGEPVVFGVFVDVGGVVSAGLGAVESVQHYPPDRYLAVAVL